MIETSTRARGRRHTTGAVVAAGALGALAGGLLWPQGSEVTPRTVEGWATATVDGTQISLYADAQGGPGEGYLVADARWTDGEVEHHGEPPTCIGTDRSARTRVELGLVTVESSDGARWDHVVRLRCLD